MKRVGKKGLSGVVTTLILILLTLVAVGVIWVVIANVINEGTEEIDIGKFTVRMEIDKVTLKDGEIDVVVKRNVGEGDFDKIKFIIDNGTDTNIFDKDADLDELEKKTFTLPYSGYVEKISISPIFGENVGNVLDSRETNWEYFDNMDNVGDWVNQHSNGASANFISSEGVMDMYTTFDASVNEYVTIRKQASTPFSPLGANRYLEIKYKIDDDGSPGTDFEVWFIACLGNLYYPRIELLDHSGEWKTEIIDIMQVIQDDIDIGGVCSGGGYSGQVEGIQLLIDDADLINSNPHFYIDYLKIGQSF